MTEVISTLCTPPSTFDDFVGTQESWKRDLLCKWELGEAMSIKMILREHDLSKELWIVSDGSVKEQSMTYGWVIANPKTERILARGSSARCGGGGSSLYTTHLGMPPTNPTLTLP